MQILFLSCIIIYILGNDIDPGDRVDILQVVNTRMTYEIMTNFLM